MDDSTSTPAAAVSPLRQRMLDDMRMRKFAEHTQAGYIRAVRKLAAVVAAITVIKGGRRHDG